jgi:hypothetical protein
VIKQGDAGATEKLLPIVYEELPRILRKVISSRRGKTL